MATLIIEGKRFEYEEEHLDIHTCSEISQDDAREVLIQTQNVFSQNDMNIYLSFGTLLGAVRDKNFIKGDLDVDVYVKDENQLLTSLWKIKSSGLYLIRVQPHMVYTFRLGSNPRCYIDVYILRRSLTFWGIYCYELNGLMIPKKYLQDGKISFLGRTFLCPADPKKLLRFWYSETWNIPIGKFEKKYKYEVSSHYYYKHFKEFLKRNFKKLYKKKE